MPSFLDEHGLNTLWAKIKDTFSLAGHSHSNYVPTSRTVNGKALSSNISLTASDVGAASSSAIKIKSVSYSSKSATGGNNLTLDSMSVGELRFQYTSVYAPGDSSSSNHYVYVYAPSGGTYYFVADGVSKVNVGGGSALIEHYRGSSGTTKTKVFLIYRVS